MTRPGRVELHTDLPRTDDVRRPTRWLLRGGRPVAQRLVRLRYDVRLRHPERVPTTGPLILASNHTAFIDGPLLAMFAPRPVHALTKIEMFHGPLKGFLHLSGQIPLDRYQADPHAVKVAVRTLRDGGALGIYPEGARGRGDFERFHLGAAYLALVTGAPIVPVTMIGTRLPDEETERLPPARSVIELVFGTAFRVDATPWPRTRQQVGETSRMLRAKMLVDLQAALDETGRSLPGSLPPGQVERDPGGGITERSA